MQNFKKIAVLRASGLGDFIFALPAFTALRETFPRAKITYLGKRWHQTFLSKRKTPFDQITVIPPVPGVGMEESYPDNTLKQKEFFKKMQKEQFDLAIQLHGGGRHSNPFLLNLGARLTIGTKTNDAPPLDKTIPYHYYQNEYLRWLEVVSLAGATTANIIPRLEVTTADLLEAKKALGNSQKIIVLHPGASDIKRRWPAKRFSAIGDYFASKGFRIIVTGSFDEEKVVREVVAQMKHKSDNFYNRLSVNGLTGLLGLAELMISNDTGPLHLANALGSKTVGIYWCGNLINAAPPFRKKGVCLSSWIVNCPLCGKDCASIFPFTKSKTTCKHETSFTAGVTVKSVIEATETLLSSPSKS